LWSPIFVSFHPITRKLGNLTDSKALRSSGGVDGFLLTGPCEKLKKTWKGLSHSRLTNPAQDRNIAIVGSFIRNQAGEL